MENLKEFMLLFRMKPNNERPTEQQLQTMQQQWGKFIGGIASQARLVSTNRLGFEGKTITNGTLVSDGIQESDGETLSGNMLLKAADLREATEMAKDCPILRMGGSVEIRSIMPMQA